MSDNFDLRESTGKKLGHEAVPDVLKSDSKKTGDKFQDTVDDIASYIPGQSKARDAVDGDAKDTHLTHDAGRQGPVDALKNALTPAGEQSTGSHVKQDVDKGLSHAQPDHNKSTTQAFVDTVTPGNHSRATDGKGVADHVVDMAVDAKNAVAGLFSSEPKTHTGSHHDTL